MHTLRGSDTAVYVGLMNNDYGLMMKSGREVSAFSTTGTETSLASNRLSYHYDLHGPSMTLNTACSSSLVGVHLACQSINVSESSFAIVGGYAFNFDWYSFM